jgi:Zn-dependent alcohol dehydrogenase
MLTIRVGNDTRRLEDVDESWITQQINNRRRAGISVCIEVRIKTDVLDLILTTPACGSGAGGRAPRPDETRIIDLWMKHGLTSDDFTAGNAVGFVKQLRGLL